jgi:uridine kinase
MPVSGRPLEYAIAAVAARSKRPLLVAIDGYSAAGKSTLARRIAEVIPNVEIVEIDDFYRVMDEDERFRLPPDRGYERDYDWERLRRELLEPLVAGQVAAYRRYDWDTGSLGGVRVVRPEGVILVEGVYSLRPELRPYYDTTLFITTPAGTREQRQAARPEPESWKRRWDAAERYYVATHRPDAIADLVVYGDGRASVSEPRARV